jgi:thiol-disulfide isomerase/thioredoxin
VPDLGSPLPSFDGVPRWLSGRAPAEADLAGKAVLVHFFSSGCPLCSEGMPAVHRVREAFETAGLVVIGVYQPRAEFTATESEAEKVCDRIVHGAHRCAADALGVLAARFGHRWAPAYYVYDRAHRRRHFQEGNWHVDALDEVIQRSI